MVISGLPASQVRPEGAVRPVRDVIFDEDRSTVRTGNGPQVMATLRNTALNLHRLGGVTNIAESYRETEFTPDRRINLLNPKTTSQRLLINNAATLGPHVLIINQRRHASNTPLLPRLNLIPPLPAKFQLPLPDQ
jgi:hypothetical protein